MLPAPDPRDQLAAVERLVAEALPRASRQSLELPREHRERVLREGGHRAGSAFRGEH